MGWCKHPYTPKPRHRSCRGDALVFHPHPESQLLSTPPTHPPGSITHEFTRFSNYLIFSKVLHRHTKMNSTLLLCKFTFMGGTLTKTLICTHSSTLLPCHSFSKILVTHQILSQLHRYSYNNSWPGCPMSWVA